MFDETTFLFRPTGPQELALVEASGWKRWPATPDFKVMTSETAVRPGEYLTRFAIRNLFLNRLDTDASDLETVAELNDNIVGAIQIIAAYGNGEQTNRSIPQCSVMPVLHYRDVRAAVAWLTFVFGFKQRLQITDHRSQLLFGNGALIAAQSDEPSPSALLVRVPHIDSHHQHAKECGATIVRPPADHPYGERQYTVTDPFGHVWTFSQTIADSDPAQWGGVLK
jgi:uncharacterized glyoxalase superfamily protein PhnB